MPTRALWKQAEASGIPLEGVLEAVKVSAAGHFGPEVSMEASLNVEEQRIDLFAAFRIEADATKPATLSAAAMEQHYGHSFDLGDELVFQVFYGPGFEAEADAQDTGYADLIGISSVGAGFWPVARRAVAPLFGLAEDPMGALVQRALLFTVATSDERGPNFVLRRDWMGTLVIKERVVVGQGEIAARHSGRRDLLEGVTVEVRRREVQLTEMITGLFSSQALSEACDGTAFTTAEALAAFDALDVHLARRTAFGTSVDRLVEEGFGPRLDKFALLVSSEREGRFIP